MAPFDRSHTISYWHSIVTMALSCVISEIKRDVDQNLYFSYPLHSTSHKVPSEYCHKDWYRKKTRKVWLPDGDKSSRIRLLVSTQHTNVTHMQTDTGRRFAALMHSIARQKLGHVTMPTPT